MRSVPLRIPGISKIPEKTIIGDRVQIVLNGPERRSYGAFSNRPPRSPFYARETIGLAVGDVSRLREADFSSSRRTHMPFQTTMKREELLDTLRENRERHQKIYDEAIVGYCEAAVAVLEDLRVRIAAGAAAPIQSSLVVPTNSLKEYDLVTRMLQCSTEDQVTLDEEQFSCYVEDNWRWQDRWLLSNSGFSKTARDYASDKKIG